MNTKNPHRLDGILAVSRATQQRVMYSAHLTCGDRPIADAMAERVERALDALDEQERRAARPGGESVKP